MNTISLPSKVFRESGLPASYFRKNLIVEKRSSLNVLQWIYKESLIKDLWTVLTSRTD